ncbi:MAG: pentapeptide repeat-containing protein [Deltaproteobacteria bacterium]|jgi:hypothetical protein|nr:pentapeptide repeat-containing protein [Deltaproteobacteria bacterium]
MSAGSGRGHRGGQGGPGGAGGGLLIGAVLVGLALTAAWPFFADLHARLTLSGARALTAAMPFSAEARAARASLAAVDRLSPDQARLVRLWLGRWWRWPLAGLVVLGLAAVSRRDPGRRCQTVHDMRSLLRVAADHWPCMKPIDKVGPVVAQANFGGRWDLAASPLQWVVEAGALLDPEGRPWTVKETLSLDTMLPKPNCLARFQRNSLDLAVVRKRFALQLGASLPDDLRELPDAQLGLAAAFLAHWLAEKPAALAILDGLSASWTPETGALDLSAAKAWLPRLEERLAADGEDGWEALDRHGAFVNVWFMGLLKLARTQGTLPSSLWIWLKPTDRTLFYALNQVGGRVAWVEAAGPWSHLSAELAAGRAVWEPRLAAAEAALAAALIEEGWLPAPESGRGRRPQAAPERKALDKKAPEPEGGAETAVGRPAEAPEETKPLKADRRPSQPQERTDSTTGVDLEDLEEPSDVDLPDVDLQDVDLQDVDLPDMDLPDMDLQDVDLQDVDLPDMDLPDMDLPDVDLQDVDLPDVDLPDVDLPDVDLPDVEHPDVEHPDVEHPDV